eukprot:1781490-Pyramimonas_sp.AAC.1
MSAQSAQGWFRGAAGAQPSCQSAAGTRDARRGQSGGTRQKPNAGRDRMGVMATMRPQRSPRLSGSRQTSTQRPSTST